MKYPLLVIAVALITALCGCRSGPSSEIEKPLAEVSTPSGAGIRIIYFHGDRRCPTCIKVGDVVQSIITAKYGDQSTVVFIEVNIDNDRNRAIAEKYQVTGSTLIVDVNGAVNDITIEAFKHAKTDPAKLETLITDIIEKGLTN